MDGRHVVLVIDDEPASLRALQRALASEYEVLAAGSGEAGLELLQRQPVSVIVTDQRMPGISGVEVLRRSLVIQPDAIRIVLTGYTDIGAIVDAVNEGQVYHYLNKPWEVRDLRLAVRRGVERLEAMRERERLIQDLERACARAEREALHKARMLTTAAHELGTPVHLAGNAIDLLATMPSLHDCEWLHVAERAIGWLQRSVAQMNTAVRLREKAVRLRRRELDLGSGLVRAVADLRAAIDARRLNIALESAPPLLVCGDDAWLREVWIALLSNAVRFTADGGHIAVRAEGAGGAVEVNIADTGIGMTREQIEVAFEPFSTAAGDLMLHSSGRFAFGTRGLGLGLSLARAVVELHGGQIDLASSPGEGTSVTVLLPATAPPS